MIWKSKIILLAFEEVLLLSQYIRKVAAGSHRGFGVEIVDKEEEAHLRELYKNGSKCGVEGTNYLIQKYITNPLLLDGHKFDFRVYLYIASLDYFANFRWKRSSKFSTKLNVLASSFFYLSSLLSSFLDCFIYSASEVWVRLK